MNKYTDRAQRVLTFAREAATRTRFGYVEPAHILLGLLDLGDCTAHKILSRCADTRGIRTRVEERAAPPEAEAFAGEIRLSSHAQRVLEHAVEEAQIHVEQFVGTEHLLIGLLCVEGTAGILKECGVTASACRQLIPELSERTPKALLELSYEATHSRVKLLETGEVEAHGFSPGGSGGGMARFNDADGYEQYIAAVKDDWLDSKDEKLGTRDMRLSLLAWIETTVLPELKKQNLRRR